MLATRHLSKTPGKNRLIGRRRLKKSKNKNEKENGRPGDNRAGVRIKETEDRNKEKGWKGKLLRVLRI